MNHEVLCRPTDDLANLLDRCGRGDEQAFARLYDATAPRAYGVALRVVRDRKLAEEVTQEAYLDAVARVPAVRPRPGQRDRLAPHPRASPRRGPGPGQPRPRPGGRRRTSDGSGRRRARHDVGHGARLARGRQVRAALAMLPPPQRQAISLAYFEGLTHTEVAAVVGAPLGTVKSRIRERAAQAARSPRGVPPAAA